jgi:hypothetical protein
MVAGGRSFAKSFVVSFVVVVPIDRSQRVLAAAIDRIVLR